MSEGPVHVPGMVTDSGSASYANKMEAGFEPGETRVSTSVTVTFELA